MSDSSHRAGMALCLSGGGYRAIVFHVGALWRLNEAGYLPRFDTISAVSGAAVAAAYLGQKFKDLEFDGNGVAVEFEDLVAKPLCSFARHSIDTVAVIEGVLNPGLMSERLVDHYRRSLFGTTNILDLPHKPEIVFGAASLQSGELWRISNLAMSEPRVGRVVSPALSLARVVAASSALPPFFSPVQVELDDGYFDPDGLEDLHYDPYTSDIWLTNGGFIDKLALEPVWDQHETILVSDGGSAFRDEPDPHTDWQSHSHRLLELIDRDKRKAARERVIEAFRNGDRGGTYWSLQSNIANYELGDPLPAPFETTSGLAAGTLRLKRLRKKDQQLIINWGYAVCDAALRKHVDPKLPAPTELPYPESPLEA